MAEAKIHHRSNDELDHESYSESDNESESIEYSSRNASLNSTRSANASFNARYAQLRAEVNQYADELHRHSPAVYREGYTRSPAKKLETSRTASSDQESSFNVYIIIAIVVAVVCAMGFFFYRPKPVAAPRIECPQFKELSEQYKNQDTSLWKSLKKNIENVVNQTPAQPGVFLLAYHDKEGSQRVIANILNATKYCMQSRDPITLEGSTFASEVMLQDYGEIIAAYRQRLEREGIMYVSDVQKIPSKAAQAFHTICDTVTPLVERSVIIFTMYVEQYSGSMTPQEIHHLVETQLETNWVDINHDTLNALIGRITDQVFLLHSENDAL